MREANRVRAQPAERPLREEYGLDKREAEWVRAQPARLAFDRTGNDAFNDVLLAEEIHDDDR